MFKKIKLTENNSNEILSKIKKVCDKFYMFEFYSATSVDGLRPYKSYPFHIHNKFVKKDNGKIKIKKVFKAFSKFIHATEHTFFQEYKTGIKQSLFNNWESMKPLIHLDTDAGSANVLYVGEEIRFLPFGGFVIYKTDKWLTGEIQSYYKYIYLPNPFHKIKKFQEEIDNRMQEWEFDAEEWIKIEQKRDEEEFEIECRNGNLNMNEIK